MITVPTTFVIGAGCSCQYGLPLGSDLYKRLRKIDSQSPLWLPLIVEKVNSRIDEPRIQALRSLQVAAGRHRGPSIDALLEDQSQHRGAGHEAIAALMGHAMMERQKIRTPPAQADWLAYLTDEMRGGGVRNSRDFATKNPVTFVTFNFDTIIEEELRSAAGRFYEDDGVDPLTQIKVIHVHGTLPDIPRGDNAQISREWILDAARCVKVIHDELDPDVVAEARSAIEQCEVLCFLGFRYETQNLMTLGIPGNIGAPGHKAMFGSAYGMESGERQRIAARFLQRIELGDIETDARTFLRKHNVIRS